MAIGKSEALTKPQTIAYLAAHVERLTKTGVFKDRQSARTVFLYLCCHPDAQVPHPDRESTWKCPVDGQHYKPDVIAEATGLSAQWRCLKA